MRLLYVGKDGGPESSTTGYWLFELKRLCSIVLLRFDGKSRDAFHDHAFDAMSWLIKGELTEEFPDGKGHTLTPSWSPIITPRETMHKVDSKGVSWAISFRGPWQEKWHEIRPTEGGRYVTLSSGRIEC